MKDCKCDAEKCKKEDLEKIQRDLDLVDEMEDTRTSNNVNWMDLVRLLLISDKRKEAKRVFRRISESDDSIRRTLGELGDD